jgi:hypothetical protein
MRMIGRAMRVEAEQVTVYGDDEPFAAALERHRKCIRIEARQMCTDDDGTVDQDLAGELVQVAHVNLWAREPSRYTPADDAYVRKTLWGVMRDARNRELGRRRIPLEGRVRDLAMDAVP